MNIDLNDEQLKAMIAGAVMTSISPEKREQLFRKAIENLMAPGTGSSFDKKSEIQKAFDYAVADVARRYAQEQIEKDTEVAKQIRSLVDEGFRKSLEGDRAKLIDGISSSITTWLTRERY